MDAVSLVLPAATVANPGSNTADASTLGAGGETAAFDFAALLAAGLMPQVLTAAAMPQTDTQVAEATQDDESAAAPGSTPDALMAAPVVLDTGVMARAAAEDGQAHGRGAAQHAAGAVTNAAAGKTDATLAAGPATLAADPAAAALLRAAEEAQALAAKARTPAEPVHAAASESSALLAQTLQSPTANATPAQPTAVLDVAAPVHGPDFAQALSQQVVWMADKDAQVAELHINPPELGPVEVRLHVAGDEATVQFSSAHAEVRNVLEAAIARLRESMAQAGIQLGEASVSAESFRERDAQQHSGAERGAQQSQRAASELAWSPTPIAAGVRRGLVDLFA